MVALPAVPLHTVTGIFEAYERANEQFDSIGMPIGLVGGECDRALWYTFRWASPPERLTGQKLRLFQTGHMEEARLIADLRRAGYEVQEFADDGDRQFKVYGIGGHLRGKLDGKVTGLPESKATHVLECKSHNDRSFKDLVKKGLLEAKPTHYAQVQVYMHLERHDRALYLAVNKNTDELYAERVPYDATFCLHLFARLERIIDAPRAPSRISDSPTKWPCVFCDHRAVCHRETFGRSHCRTCVHATPVVDAAATNAPWACERFGKTLSLEEQKAGCPAHLFLPDVVPGAQVDAGDDFISYQMPDGSTWRDGVQEGASNDRAA